MKLNRLKTRHFYVFNEKSPNHTVENICILGMITDICYKSNSIVHEVRNCEHSLMKNISITKLSCSFVALLIKHELDCTCALLSKLAASFSHFREKYE